MRSAPLTLVASLVLLNLAIVAAPVAQTLPAEEAAGSAEEPNGGDDAWAALGAERRPEIDRIAADYMAYLARARTESLAVKEAARLAGLARFRPWQDGVAAKPGDGFLVRNRGRALLLVRPGKRSLDDGLRIVASHIDSPRLDVKARPLYTREGLALLQTVPHGGIKNYQWGNVPLALVGHVDRLDGRRVSVSVGLAADEPVMVIPDLAPHVNRPRRERKSRDVLKGEELDPVIGSMAGADGVEEAIVALLAERFDIERDDFVSAELSLVPALAPREVGLDRGMILGYGQDNQLCSYAALRALIDAPSPLYWSAVYLADNEETGSGNNTGAKAAFLETQIGRWLEADGGFDGLRLRRVLQQTVVVSADVTTGVNPLDASVHEKGNAAQINGGVVIKRYGRGGDANSEVIAETRRILDRHQLPWQTHTYKVGVGGGGTLGGFLSVRGMEVIDVGAPVLSAHSPAELSSKADVYALYAYLRAFLSE